VQSLVGALRKLLCVHNVNFATTHLLASHSLTLAITTITTTATTTTTILLHHLSPALHPFPCTRVEIYSLESACLVLVCSGGHTPVFLIHSRLWQLYPPPQTLMHSCTIRQDHSRAPSAPVGSLCRHRWAAIERSSTQQTARLSGTPAVTNHHRPSLQQRLPRHHRLWLRLTRLQLEKSCGAPSASTPARKNPTCRNTWRCAVYSRLAMWAQIRQCATPLT
jgi:hypothetical protein